MLSYWRRQAATGASLAHQYLGCFERENAQGDMEYTRRRTAVHSGWSLTFVSANTAK